MKNYVLLFLCTWLTFQLFAQQLLPIREKYFWGFIDTTGTVVIPPRYEQVGQFDQYGYTMVRDQQKIGMITKKNKLIVPCEYDNIRSLDATHIGFLEGDTWGALNLKSKKKTPAAYKSIRVMYAKDSIDLYAVRKGLRWGVVREEGEEVIAPVYKKVIYQDSVFWVTNENDRVGLFGFKGNSLLPEIHDSLYIENYPHVHCIFKSQGGDALFNIENERQTEYNIQESHMVGDGDKLVRVRETFKGWNVLKLDDYSPLFEKYYNSIDEQGEYFILRKASVFGVADFEGNILVTPKYDQIKVAPYKGFWVSKKGMLGLVNKQGTELIAPKYLRIASLNKHYFIAMTQSNEIQILSSQGKIVTEKTYKNIVQDENNIKLYHDKGVLVLELDESGKIVDRTELEQVATVKLKGNNFNRFSWASANFRTQRSSTTQTVRTNNNQNNLIQKKKLYTHSFEKVYQDGKVGINLKINSVHSKTIISTQFWVIKLNDFYYGNVARAILVGGRQCLLVRKGNTIRPVYNFNVEYHGKSKVSPIAFIGEFSENGLAPINAGGRTNVRTVWRPSSQADEDNIWNELVIKKSIGTVDDMTTTYGQQVGGGKWGFINREGEMVIPPRYDCVKNFLSDRAIVGKGRLVKTTRGKQKVYSWGVISETKDTIIPMIYGKIDPVRLSEDKYLFYVYSFKSLKGIANQYGREISDVSYRKIGKVSEGMIPVQQRHQWLYLDTLGNVYKTKNKKLKIQKAGGFGEDVVPIRAGNIWGYVDSKYDTILKFIYKRADRFSHGLAPAKVHHHYGYINKKGEYVIKEKYKKAQPFQENGLAIAKKNHYGLLDTKGKWVLSPKYYKVFPFYDNGLALVKDHRRRKDYLLVNQKGKVITKRKYQYIGKFGEDSLAIVRKHHHYGVIDINGNEILNPKENKKVYTYKKVKGDDYIEIKKKAPMFNKIGSFNNGYAAAQGYNVETRKKGWGYINTKLEWVVDPIYNHATDFKDGFAVVYNKKANHWYMVDSRNLSVRGIGDYHQAVYSNGLVCVKDKYKEGGRARYRYFYLNEEGKKAFYTADNESNTFSKAYPFKDGYAIVKTENGYGMIDVTGTFVLDDHYRKIEYKDGLYVVTINTFVGIQNHDGEDVLEPNYERINKVTPTILQVRKGGQVGYVFSNGVWLWEPRR